MKLTNNRKIMSIIIKMITVILMMNMVTMIQL